MTNCSCGALFFSKLCFVVLGCFDDIPPFQSNGFFSIALLFFLGDVVFPIADLRGRRRLEVDQGSNMTSTLDCCLWHPSIHPCSNKKATSWLSNLPKP